LLSSSTAQGLEKNTAKQGDGQYFLFEQKIRIMSDIDHGLPCLHKGYEAQNRLVESL